MPDILIEQATFARLQRHARPLLDTADAVVNRALDALEGVERDMPDDDALDVDMVLEARRLPDLTHTKVLRAYVGQTEVEKPNWNRLLDEIVVQAMQYQSFAKVRQICPANLVKGERTIDGYHFLAQVNASVQGMSANEACRALVETANQTGMRLEVAFLWRDREGATHPGLTARFELQGNPPTH